ncbi:hypothetical protein KIPB_001027 [Kipferlia bialata]|uniref:Uncharacterized protein n=1 Tax=Kipferlia bialata TaxID=797122 RepID=A0A9K3CPQ0_9EUKA|nr:hypothetical protein KIPB_001027 [Kipferlia bialata]|eukprot:g1027.t1
MYQEPMEPEAAPEVPHNLGSDSDSDDAVEKVQSNGNHDSSESGEYMSVKKVGCSVSHSADPVFTVGNESVSLHDALVPPLVPESVLSLFQRVWQSVVRWREALAQEREREREAAQRLGVQFDQSLIEADTWNTLIAQFPSLDATVSDALLKAYASQCTSLDATVSDALLKAYASQGLRERGGVETERQGIVVVDDADMEGERQAVEDLASQTVKEIMRSPRGMAYSRGVSAILKGIRWLRLLTGCAQAYQASHTRPKSKRAKADPTPQGLTVPVSVLGRLVSSAYPMCLVTCTLETVREVVSTASYSYTEMGPFFSLLATLYPAPICRVYTGVKDHSGGRQLNQDGDNYELFVTQCLELLVQCLTTTDTTAEASYVELELQSPYIARLLHHLHDNAHLTVAANTCRVLDVILLDCESDRARETGGRQQSLMSLVVNRSRFLRTVLRPFISHRLLPLLTPDTYSNRDSIVHLVQSCLVSHADTPPYLLAAASSMAEGPDWRERLSVTVAVSRLCAANTRLDANGALLCAYALRSLSRDRSDYVANHASMAFGTFQGVDGDSTLMTRRVMRNLVVPILTRVLGRAESGDVTESELRMRSVLLKQLTGIPRERVNGGLEVPLHLVSKLLSLAMSPYEAGVDTDEEEWPLKVNIGCLALTCVGHLYTPANAAENRPDVSKRVLI